MITIFSKLADNIRNTDLLKFWEEFWESDLQYDKLILESQRDRLRNLGVDIFGSEIRTYGSRTPNVYANMTIAIKQSKGQATNKVTLTDTGDFLNNNIEIVFEDATAKIDFFDKKDDGNISDNVNLDNVFGWTENDFEILKNYILPKLQTYILSKWLQF